MADSPSESDSSSVEMSGFVSPVSPSKEQLARRNESLQQENKVLKMELDAFKIRVRNLNEENHSLKRANINLYAKAEEEEECISNNLLKQITALKKEKEVLVLKYEQEEKCLTNELNKKLIQLQDEKTNMELVHVNEQRMLRSSMTHKVQELQHEVEAKQACLEQLRREKVDFKNTMEQEQENNVNKLRKRLDQMREEKRMLQERLDQLSIPRMLPEFEGVQGGNIASLLTIHVENLRAEVSALKKQLLNAQTQYSDTMLQLAAKKKNVKDRSSICQKQLDPKLHQGFSEEPNLELEKPSLAKPCVKIVDLNRSLDPMHYPPSAESCSGSQIPSVTTDQSSVDHPIPSQNIQGDDSTGDFPLLSSNLQDVEFVKPVPPK